MNKPTLFGQFLTSEHAVRSTANAVLALNELTRERGLTLTPEQALDTARIKNTALVHCERIEFGIGALEKLIDRFSRSTFIQPADWHSTLNSLCDIFYGSKTDSDDKLSDNELIDFMFDRFENYCGGDLTLLAEQCDFYAARLRGGLSGLSDPDGESSFELDETDAKSLWDEYERE